MKKFICIALMVAMVLTTGAWTSSTRAVDNSELFEELEDQGFTRRGDVWTFEAYHDDEFVWVVAWFDVVDNYGVMTTYSYVDEWDYKATTKTCKYIVEWDYDESEFVILESEEYTK